MGILCDSLRIEKQTINFVHYKLSNTKSGRLLKGLSDFAPKTFSVNCIYSLKLAYKAIIDIKRNKKMLGERNKRF